MATFQNPSISTRSPQRSKTVPTGARDGVEGVLDHEALKRLLKMIGGDPDDLADLINDFDEEAPGLVAQMRDAATSGNTDAVRRHAHSLKGNAADFGAVTLQALCADLEGALKRAEAVDLTASIERIDAEQERARAALNAIEVEGLGG